MDPEKLIRWGKRSITAGIALLPFDAALIIAFIVFTRDTVGAISLTMTLLALSAVLVGFGAAALSSGKADQAGHPDE